MLPGNSSRLTSSYASARTRQQVPLPEKSSRQRGQLRCLRHEAGVAPGPPLRQAPFHRWGVGHREVWQPAQDHTDTTREPQALGFMMGRAELCLIGYFPSGHQGCFLGTQEGFQ